MSFFEKLFGKSRPALPDIPFGRYTDAFKSDDQVAAWNRSIELFDKGEHLNAYGEFLVYLRDDSLKSLFRIG